MGRGAVTIVRPPAVRRTEKALETMMRLLDDYDVLTRRIYNAKTPGNAAVLEQRRRDTRTAIERCATRIYQDGTADAFEAMASWASQRADLRNLT